MIGFTTDNVGDLHLEHAQLFELRIRASKLRDKVTAAADDADLRRELNLLLLKTRRKIQAIKSKLSS